MAVVTQQSDSVFVSHSGVNGVRLVIPDSVYLLEKICQEIHEPDMAVDHPPLGGEEADVPLGVQLVKPGLKVYHTVQ